MNFCKETSFKESPIGKIPKDWEVADADFASVLKGFAFSSDFFNGKGEGIPLIRIRDLGNEETESHYSGPYDDTYLIRKGDILVSMDGEFNAYLWNGSEGLLNQRVCKIWSRNPAKLDNLFLYYEIQKPLKIIEMQTSQTTVKHLLDRDTKRMKIPLPPYPEQEKVAEILSTVDLAVGKVDEVIAKTERLKKGLMQELLTKGIGHKEFKDTKIGKTPKEWHVVKLGEVCEVGTGGTPSRKHPEYFDGDIPWAKSTEIDYSIIAETEEHITKLGLQNSNAQIYPTGTLLIAMYGQGITRGKCAILGVDAAINQACASIIPKVESIHVPYLYYWCQYNYARIRNFGQGANQPNLNLSLVRSIRVALPSSPEQREIAEILSTVDRKLELERKEKIKIVRTKRGLMGLLLTGKVRVKVD